MTTYRIHSWPAIVGGSVAAAGAIALLTRDAAQTGLTLDHALMPVLVGLTILTGHLAWQAVCEWKLSAVPLALLAILGSGITVYETMGRRAETRDTKAAAATKSVDDYAALVANLARANALTVEAESWVANECRTGVGPKCRGVTFTRDQRRAHADQLRRDVEAHKAPAPVDPKADRVAAVAGLVGYQGDVKRAVQTFEPFVLPLFLELGAIFLFGFGIRHSRETPAPKVEAQSMTTFERPLSDAEIEELRRVLKGMTHAPNQQEIAERSGISEGEISKRIRKAEAAGVIQKIRDGRFNRIHLVA